MGLLLWLLHAGHTKPRKGRGQGRQRVTHPNASLIVPGSPRGSPQRNANIFRNRSWVPVAPVSHRLAPCYLEHRLPSVSVASSLPPAASRGSDSSSSLAGKLTLAGIYCPAGGQQRVYKEMGGGGNQLQPFYFTSNKSRLGLWGRINSLTFKSVSKEEDFTPLSSPISACIPSARWRCGRNWELPRGKEVTEAGQAVVPGPTCQPLASSQNSALCCGAGCLASLHGWSPSTLLHPPLSLSNRVPRSVHGPSILKAVFLALSEDSFVP